MNNAFGTTPESDYLPDIQDVLNILRGHIKLIVAIVAVSCIIGFTIVMTRPVYYRAAATVIVDDHNVELKNFEDVTKSGKFDNWTIQTEVKMILSPSLARQTISDIDLAAEEEFSDFKNDDPKLVSVFLDRLSAAAQGESRVIEVGFKAKDRTLAAKIANAHVDNYLKSQVDFKKKRIEQLKTWFEDKVRELKIDVMNKSRAVGEFRAREDLAIGKDSQELVYQEITSVSEQLSPVRVRKYDVQAKLEAVEAARAAGLPDSIADIVQSPLIQELKKQRSTVSQEVQSMQTAYGRNHPKLKAAQRQLSRIDAAIAEETKNITSSLENDLAAAQAQEDLLSDRLTTLKRQADDLRMKSVTLDSLLVEQEASQKILDNFLANFENIQSQVNFIRPDAAILSPAAPAIYPAGIGKKILLFIVVAFSGSLALAAAFMIEILHNGPKDFKSVRRMGQTPLGIIPEVDGPLRIMESGARSSLKEAIKQIYMGHMIGSPAKSFLITSALPQEGRTTFTLLLAHYLASAGHKVLVIDADYLKPSLGKIAGIGLGPGLSDLLAGQAALDETLHEHPGGFTVMGVGTGERKSPQALNPDNLRALLDGLKDDYSHILIDSGPIMARTEAVALAARTDSVIVVTKWLKTSKEDLAATLDLLKNLPASILGVVLNQVDIGLYKSKTGVSDFLLPNPNIVKAA
ncbi:MAG: polysaccharide biosynthesis tyrosine autokinase [Alphaproteobacteria bacterium]|nr:polysaccharide biosynthesis tyrosine autokinase [Alphaproteobacteria bacterium]